MERRQGISAVKSIFILGDTEWGGARDIMCESLLRLPSEVRPMLRVMVHDEIVCSIKKEDVPEVSREIMKAMQWDWRGVPIACDMTGGRNWGEASAK